MKKNSWRMFFFVLATLSVLSCTIKKLDQSLDFNTVFEGHGKPFNGVLGVDEFVDLRQQASTSDDNKWLGFIPGVLWIKIASETPDTYTGFTAFNTAHFKMAFAQALFESLEQNRVFEQTLFLPRDRYSEMDYRLEGILNRTSLIETGYYYGSGFYAWITRIMGLPYVSYEFSVDMTLRLRRLDTNEIVWSHQIRGDRRDKYYNVYQLNIGKEGKHVLSYNFSKILEEQMPNVLRSMRLALKNH